ncbi:maleylpyruvate isomerase family mycothiol-dependent enzyme [Streptomyces rochei]|uniref:Maleylpyruvate isomerase family mycothiol-dependent enzyme n=1 Tax=Streptomyces rochei TaxID=1928 RepID=A0AAX3ZJR8_STRRO|nr:MULTISPECIES: maleylpyruvate isomerase family mycothiol-dependent enzyme [Streptomyces]RIH61215.1 maleylpyruvate isomerase family mycothiol-dependent enzyme [Streptomyces sp. SHP22-7]MBJ6620129.1 maleylpyruvate isomerase family mycothiol-dependent enzyme [Streptomyces sp. DHE17-7]MBU8550385.1 maleylpyruvate isomerase family mycothiol-dependent enzyme [Streptomyces sp. Osf17]MBU8557163.1 maleylpyruvate isomerase family mycothiol-dependent enzyme [Streptomyces sp. Babs14]MCC8451396.1 maleylpy
MTTPADVHDVRDPERPGRLLAAERDELLPLLRSRTDADFALPVAACPGWTVRDVLAHCSSALTRAVENRFERGVFSPESNDRDIAERADWTNAQVLDELERGMTEAGPVIGRAGGVLDMLALGEWVHAGDVRVALGEPGAYAGRGLPEALALLGTLTRDRGHVPLHADLDDVDEPLKLGGASGERPPGRFIGDAPTLVRLYAGRPVEDGNGYELAGVEAAELNLFGG